jgi:dipeptidyl aminopeptidase/acylaminoacyl peptidase
VIRSKSVKIGLAFVIAAPALLSGQEKRPITPADCVNVRYLEFDNSLVPPITLSPNGTRVAYLVKSPNLQTNVNEYDLYIKKVTTVNSSAVEKPLIVSSSLSMMHWIGDGESLSVLYGKEGRRVIEIVNAINGSHETMVDAGTDIVEYTIDHNGSTVVFETEDQSQLEAQVFTSEEMAEGYLIPFQQQGGEIENEGFSRRRLFITRRVGARWTRPIPITVRSPFSGQPLADLRTQTSLRLSISPDGKNLLLQYVEPKSQLPESWKSSLSMRAVAGFPVPGITVMVDYNLESGTTVIPLKTEYVWSLPLWSADSRWVAVVAQSPLGSELEERDFKTGDFVRSAAHLFSLEVATGKVQQVASHVTSNGQQPLLWKENGDLLVRTSAETLTVFSRRGDAWQMGKEFRIPLSNFYRFSSLTSNGQTILGDYQNPATPPELFLEDTTTNTIGVFAKLNPEFDNLTIAPTKAVEWTTSTGVNIHGLLFYPPNFETGRRYPMVIQTHPVAGGFACDFGPGHYPSYAPQPLADAGIMYLARTYPEGWTAAQEETRYPTGYPGVKGEGGLQEAAFNMDVWDSAVASLSKQGIIDSSKVGVIGFSRKGWYVEFMLARAGVHYRAATATDNIQYSMGEYWLYRADADLRRSMDAMYGGPPYGDNLKGWRDYSVSFNLDKFHTPLLMEEIGHGIKDNSAAPPSTLAAQYEVFTGLKRLEKPVEMYYYPLEEHQMDHPVARLHDLQRNVDWYRFWLQGYERTSPDSSDQYARWHKLRALDSADRGRPINSQITTSPEKAGGSPNE